MEIYAIAQEVGQTDDISILFPVARQTFRPEYSRLPSSSFENNRLGSTPSKADGLQKTWNELRQVTKERLLLGLHLRLLKVFKDTSDEHKQFVADLSWQLRRCFVEETDKDKLFRHFLNLYDNTISNPSNWSWITEAGVLSMVTSYVSGKSHQFAQAVYTILVTFRSNCSVIIGTTMLIGELRRFATDIDRLDRKLRACRLMLSFWDIRLLEQFDNGTVDDLYLKRLKQTYDSTWRDVVIGPLRQCNSCGSSRIMLLTCALCMQEHIKKKTRYCGRICQSADWLEHRKIHKSCFDYDKHVASVQDYRNVFGALLTRQPREFFSVCL